MCKRMIRNAKIAEVVSYYNNTIYHVYPNNWIDEELFLINQRLSKIK